MAHESSGYPQLQEDPEFYRRVLDHLPTPVIVVSAGGDIVYGNKAMVELTGRAGGDRHHIATVHAA